MIRPPRSLSMLATCKFVFFMIMGGLARVLHHRFRNGIKAIHHHAAHFLQSSALWPIAVARTTDLVHQTSPLEIESWCAARCAADKQWLTSQREQIHNIAASHFKFPRHQLGEVGLQKPEVTFSIEIVASGMTVQVERYVA